MNWVELGQWLVIGALLIWVWRLDGCQREITNILDDVTKWMSDTMDNLLKMARRLP